MSEVLLINDWVLKDDTQFVVLKKRNNLIQQVQAKKMGYIFSLWQKVGVETNGQINFASIFLFANNLKHVHLQMELGGIIVREVNEISPLRYFSFSDLIQ